MAKNKQKLKIVSIIGILNGKEVILDENIEISIINSTQGNNWIKATQSSYEAMGYTEIEFSGIEFSN